MKSCTKNRKLIAWLRLAELSPVQEQAIRAHMEHCEICRRYDQELTHLSGVLSAGAEASQIEASDTFHQKVMSRLRRTEKQSKVASLWQSLRLAEVNVRLAIPIVVSVVICALFFFRAALSRQTRPESRSIVVVRPATSEVSPSILNYHVVANRSFASFDELLTKQASRNLAPSPVYKLSSRPLAFDAD
jgi:predicted anti-sigma-YlaC factor YlaD